MAQLTKASALKVARDFMRFVDSSPSPYHVVSVCKQRLIDAGFKELKEHHSHWEIKPEDKFFVTKNQSTIVACAVGANWKPGNGFTMVGAHTDSPCPRIKVVSKREKEGYAQVGTECYGGGNWVSWFDRDLKVAGRLLVREDNNKIISRLIDIDRPVMRIPHVAIHLLRTINQNFSVNKEDDLVPVIATAVKKELGSKEKEDIPEWKKKHHPILINMIANEANITPEALVDFDLYLADHQSSSIGGAEDDFIFAPRIDNLLSMYAGLQGFTASLENGSLAKDDNVRMLVGYDNEEVGSRSAQGAGSHFTELVMRRVCSHPSNPIAFEESIGKSMLLSADNCHAIHPNYASKHESKMKPTLHGGPVISTSGAQNFATTVITATIMRELAKMAGVDIQESMGRNDVPSGSTIGPVLAAKLGLKTVDIGASQLSMHSCREMCGVMSPEQCTLLYSTFFQNYCKVNESIESD